MPAMGLLTGTVQRTYGGLPALPLINLISERAITEPSQFVLQARPRLQNYLSSAWGGAMPIRALYRADGVLAGDIFGVYVTTFHSRDEGVIGTISGSLIPSIAGNQMGVVVTAGEDAKFWDGVDYRDVLMADAAYVTKVMEHQGRFIFIRASSHRYYWTLPLANMLDESGDIMIEGGDFASEESEPDWLVDGLVWRDHLVLAGTETIGLHGVTGNDNLPWAPSLGSTINSGVFGTGALCKFGDTFAWVSPERSVWRYNGSNEPQRVSNAGIEERLKGWGTIQADSFYFEGREFLHIWDTDAPDETDLFLDNNTGEWCEWESDGTYFEGGPACSVGTDYPVFGAKSEAKLVTMSTRSDFGNGFVEDAIEHRITFGIPIDGGSVPIHNVGLRCRTYDTGTVTLSLRTSRDKGNSWSAWKPRTISDALRNKVEWRALGLADSPGFLCEVKTAGATEFSVSGAYFNDFVRGRARV